ncbi:diadenylate cyclase CdaA [Clostridium mediterraneense]|uniref:diadenylate cyclase CdaA n=1 Tax=Clostridium mediterraneense TaxID=1805472 RepID=UPI00082F0F49|nr:diadenylate cyclase CdaA [Clostridium mediterraneense]
MQELEFLFNITKSSISIWAIIDILVVAYIFYKGYKLIQETRAEQLLKGILLILLLIPISHFLRLNTLNFILTKTLTIGVLSMVIIFQPEIRKALEHIGSSTFNDLHILADDEELEHVVDELVEAVSNMAATKTGALIALEQKTGLDDFVKTGTQIDAVITDSLIENIFVKNTPLHDGAMIISYDRIVAAGCVLPLTNNLNIDKLLGTRHRAAIGLSEASDALIIVVSEETGNISLAVKGRLTKNYDKEKLKNMLLRIMRNRRDKGSRSLKGRVEEWVTKLRRKKY